MNQPQLGNMPLSFVSTLAPRLLAAAACVFMLSACGSKTVNGSGSVKAYQLQDKAKAVKPKKVSKKAKSAKVSKPLTICSGFGCEFKDRFRFSSSNKKRLAAIMAAGKSSAKAERTAIAKAIGAMENMTRSRLRFGRDVEKAYQKNRGRRGQMDCVDESLNTTAYLYYLQKNGMLRYHKPRKSYAERGFLLDGRYPHKSAVMIDKKGTAWSVDSWYGKGGEKAQIMLLKKWRKVRNPRSS